MAIEINVCIYVANCVVQLRNGNGKFLPTDELIPRRNNNSEISGTNFFLASGKKHGGRNIKFSAGAHGRRF